MEIYNSRDLERQIVKFGSNPNCETLGKHYRVLD